MRRGAERKEDVSASLHAEVKHDAANERLNAVGSQKGRTVLQGEGQITESQLLELQNMRVLIEEARLLARNLAYHRRARLEDVLGRSLDEVDEQIEDLRTKRG
jgi:hypothetical protein